MARAEIGGLVGAARCASSQSAPNLDVKLTYFGPAGYSLFVGGSFIRH
ncbi:hypothetical protein [Cupriavidus sp. CP313]